MPLHGQNGIFLGLCMWQNPDNSDGLVKVCVAVQTILVLMDTYAADLGQRMTLSSSPRWWFFRGPA